MDPSHSDTHLPNIGNLLSLEAVQVSLDGRGRVFEVLSRRLQAVFQLVAMHISEFCKASKSGLSYLADSLSRLANAIPPRGFGINVHHSMQRI